NMMQARRITSTVSSNHGIALLMVLWVLTALSILAFSFSYLTRTDANATISFRKGLENKFLAEAGVERAVMEILYKRSAAKTKALVEEGELWRADGTPHEIKIGEGLCTVRIRDEAGKIDINTLTPSSGIILKNLLINLNVSPENADTIVDSVLDWKDADDLRRLHGAENNYYRSLPNPYDAKNGNFVTPEELLLVKGVTPKILYGDSTTKGLIEFVTTLSRTPRINVNGASKEVLLAIPGLTPLMVDAILTVRQGKEIATLEEIRSILADGYQAANRFLTAGSSNILSIESMGHEQGKKGYAVRATVTIDASNRYRYLYYKGPVTVSGEDETSTTENR
ncbi:MAG: hypothetical protein ABIN58_11555, partial [candidate division WOR-3 bacterium]